MSKGIRRLGELRIPVEVWGFLSFVGRKSPYSRSFLRPNELCLALVREILSCRAPCLKWNLGKVVYLQVSSKSMRHHGYS